MSVLRRARAPFERLVLRSPARQRAYDRSMVLLRYLGRYTGSYHERAISVARDGSRLVSVFPRGANNARRGKEWWLNFRPSGPAVLILDDVQLGVVGRLIDGAEHPSELVRALRAYLDRLPRAARQLGLRRATAVDDLESVASGFVAVVFDLRAEPATR